MNLWGRLRGGDEGDERGISTIDEYALMYSQFSFGGLLGGGLQQTLAGQTTELAPSTFAGLAQHAYGANGVVFACMLVRQMLFSTIRFQWQRLRDGNPSSTYSTPALNQLEKPWTGGTTQDLVSKMLQHSDLAGNAYVALLNNELVVMRPDWVDIVVEPRDVSYGKSGVGQIGYRKLGFIYTEGGDKSGNDPVYLWADQVAHFCPIPDPLATFRGMSWLTPILREIQADQAMTKHQSKFFDNGATVNMVVKHPSGATRDKVEAWVKEFEAEHRGAENAYKTLQLYPGADATPVGSNMKDIDFKEVRGGGETRIAAAAGIAPVIVGLSEGLAAATYSNYGQARRRVADGTAHPWWQNLSGSMQQIIRPPDKATRLWYATTDVPFLREDEKDAADIQKTRAETISTLITAGYKPESVVAAVSSGDFGLLVHTGMYSVQLQKPGQESPSEPAAPPADPAPPEGGSDGDDE